MLFPAATLITSGLARVIMVTDVVISMHTQVILQEDSLIWAILSSDLCGGACLSVI